MTDETSNPDAKANARPAGVRVSTPKCVRCDQPVQARYRPFCSQRCMDADLGAWLGGGYRVATEEGPDSSPGDDQPDDQ
jgi:uncharacterized protein